MISTTLNITMITQNCSKWFQPSFSLMSPKSALGCFETALSVTLRYQGGCFSVHTICAWHYKHCGTLQLLKARAASVRPYILHSPIPLSQLTFEKNPNTLTLQYSIPHTGPTSGRESREWMASDGGARGRRGDNPRRRAAPRSSDSRSGGWGGGGVRKVIAYKGNVHVRKIHGHNAQ